MSFLSIKLNYLSCNGYFLTILKVNKGGDSQINVSQLASNILHLNPHIKTLLFYLSKSNPFPFIVIF